MITPRHIDTSSYLRIGRAAEIGKRTDRLVYRLFEMLPGVLAWGTLIGVVVLSAARPVWVGVFIVLFDIYWLLKTIFLSLHLVFAYRKMKKNLATDWLKELEKLPASNQVTEDQGDRVSARGGSAFGGKGKDILENDPTDHSVTPSLGHSVQSWRDIWHLVILPVYNEPLEIIHLSMRALANASYPHERLIVVLATEARAGTHGEMLREKIREEFEGVFFRFLATVHPDDVIGEIAGKGSNETWAGRESKKIVDELGIPYAHVVVSVLDSDTRIFPDYFGRVTYAYLTAPNPLRTSYQPVPVFANNIWDAPFFSRVVASSATFWHMMQQERQERLATFSSHSMSFAAIVEMDFWQTNIVSEDSRVFWQALLTFDGDYRVAPLHYPVSMDACLAETFFETARNQYKQQRRWGWGVENIPYLLFGFLKNKHIVLRKKFYYAGIQLEGFWSWSTNAILIFLLGWLPLVVGGASFNQSVFSYNLPLVTRSLMMLAMVGLFVSAAISMLLLPPRPARYYRRHTVGMVLQWICLPITIMLLGAFPGLEAQTRLMLGRYLGFWVTEKARKV